MFGLQLPSSCAIGLLNTNWISIHTHTLSLLNILHCSQDKVCFLAWHSYPTKYATFTTLVWCRSRYHYHHHSLPCKKKLNYVIAISGLLHKAFFCLESPSPSSPPDKHLFFVQYPTQISLLWSLPFPLKAELVPLPSSFNILNTSLIALIT